MPSASVYQRLIGDLRRRYLGQEVTVYRSYGHPDPRDRATYIVPLRIWAHDNRETPFVEQAFERWAIRYFEDDLKRALFEEERSRLERTLAFFIADDERLRGMERITGEDVAVFLGTSELEAEMMMLVAESATAAPNSAKLQARTTSGQPIAKSAALVSWRHADTDL